MPAVALPSLKPGQKVVRLSNSKTGRAIGPGTLGVIGGLQWKQHDNPSEFEPYGYIPIQWQNGLWSNLEATDRGVTWQYHPKPTAAQEEQLEDE